MPRPNADYRDFSVPRTFCTTPYVQQSAYWPHGALWYWQYGNNVWPVETYNNMLQPYNVYATVGNSPNGYLLYLGYSNWNAGGTLAQTQEGYGAGVGWNAMTWLGQTYSYDHMNRLLGVTDTNYSRGFAYDEFGNMSVNANTVVPLSGLTPWTNSVPYNRANNHLVAGTYGTQTGNVDQRGNLTGIGAVSLFYDGESRVTQVVDGATENFVYDALGQRVETVNVTSGATTVYVRDAFGQMAAEYDSVGVVPDCVTCYLSADHLGSTRMVTDQGGNVVARHDYLPYGEEVAGVAGRVAGSGFGSSANVTQMFTGQERDGGTLEMDCFNARHFSAVLGGFAQVDPGNAGGDFLRPQSWNGYGYVLGNPLGLVDLSGMSSNYSGIQDGLCPASQQTCPAGNPPPMSSAGPSFPNEIESGLSWYLSTTVAALHWGVAFDTAISYEGDMAGGVSGIYLGKITLTDWAFSAQVGGVFGPILPCTFCTGPSVPTPSGSGAGSGFIAASNRRPFAEIESTVNSCEAQATASARPYMKDVKMPSANELVGTGLLATAASVFTKGNPIAIAISAASVMRKQIGGLVNGFIAHNSAFTGCSIMHGINPIAFTGSF